MLTRYRFFAPARGRLTAVATWRATPDERKMSLSRPGQIDILSALARAPSPQSLITLYELATGIEWNPLDGPTGAVLLSRVAEAIDRGTILFIPDWNLAGDSETSNARTDGRLNPEAKLALDVMESQETISFEGSRYRLVPSRLRWARRDSHIVPAAEAKRVIARMTQRMGNTPHKRSLWEKVAESLTDADGAERGLLLLRDEDRTTSPTPQSASGPAVMPSKVRAQVAETQWIEILALYEDGTPYKGTAIVTVPGGRKLQGPPGEGGITRLDGLDPGTCDVSFPELDARDIHYQG